MLALVSALALNAAIVAPSWQSDLVGRGSDSTMPVMKQVAEAYRSATGSAVKLEGGGSSKGVEACQKGEVKFCFISRELKEKEKSDGLIAMPYALDGVAIIVNKSNPVENLTVEQLRDIYSGATTTWPDGKPVVAFNRNQDSGTREVFETCVMKDVKVTEKAAIKHDGVILSTVAKIPGAIAFTAVGDVNSTVKAVRVGDVAPTFENFRNKKYPLVRTLNVATKGEPSAEVKTFFDWIASDNGQQAVADAGFCPLKAGIEAKKPVEQSANAEK